MIKKTSRCRDKQIDTFLKLICLCAAVCATHDNTKGLRVMGHEFLRHTEDLECKLSSWRDNDDTCTCNTQSPATLANHKIDHAPFRGLNFILCRSSTAGIKKAKVFPEPVLAAPSTSLPANSGGIDFS